MPARLHPSRGALTEKDYAVPARARKAPRKAVVPAVGRAARLLDAVARAKAPVTLAGLIADLDLPKSTTHGLCATLVGAGLLARLPNGTYQLGTHVMDLAHAYLARTDITTEFVRVWDTLAALPEETIILSVLDGPDVVYLACRSGQRPLGVTFRIGMRLPATCTATGKAQLSTLAPERVVTLLQSHGFRALTRKSIADMETLLDELAAVRRRGYSIDDEETHDGMICFGAPVFDSHGGEAAAGVAVSMLKATASKQLAALAARNVMRVAEALSRRLGARGSPRLPAV